MIEDQFLPWWALLYWLHSSVEVKVKLRALWQYEQLLPMSHAILVAIVLLVLRTVQFNLDNCIKHRRPDDGRGFMQCSFNWSRCWYQISIVFITWTFYYHYVTVTEQFTVQQGPVIGFNHGPVFSASFPSQNERWKRISKCRHHVFFISFNSLGITLIYKMVPRL